jgi:hypothetical protein
MPPKAVLMANHIAGTDKIAVTRKPFIHRAHNIGTTAQTDEVGSDDRGNHAHATNKERKAHQVEEQTGIGHAFTSRAISTMVAPTVTT